MEDIERCPLCNKPFPVIELISHVDRCAGGVQKSNDVQMSDARGHDADFEFALKLQQEEDNARNSGSNKKPRMTDEEFARSLAAEDEKSQPQKHDSSLIKCQLCSTGVDIDSLYILDDCTHKFCKNCLMNYVSGMIQKSVKLECPLKGCGKDLSVRDMKDLLPTIKKNHEAFNPTKGSGQATERIMAEYKHIMKSSPEKNGYSAEPINDNMYKWELRFFNFDKTDPLGQDMATYKIKHITLHIVFPKSYPFSPPYIRVINPRFAYRTGHVTIGGSICMELLTNKGWSPANTIEAIIVSIRAQLIAGGARLDPSNRHDYTEAEAKDAFDRMVRDHNWY